MTDLFAVYPSSFNIDNCKVKVKYNDSSIKKYKLTHFIGKNSYYPLKNGRIIVYIHSNKEFIIYNHQFKITSRIKLEYNFSYFIDVSPNENHILFVEGDYLASYDRKIGKLAVDDEVKLKSRVTGKFLDNTIFVTHFNATIGIFKIDNFWEDNVGYIKSNFKGVVTDPVIIGEFIILCTDEGINRVDKDFEHDIIYPDSKDCRYLHIDKESNILYGFSSSADGKAKITRWNLLSSKDSSFDLPEIIDNFIISNYSGGLPGYGEVVFQEIMKQEYNINITTIEPINRNVFRIDKDKVKQEVKEMLDNYLPLVPVLKNIVSKFFL